jgi:hypothetical protein
VNKKQLYDFIHSKIASRKSEAVDAYETENKDLVKQIIERVDIQKGESLLKGLKDFLATENEELINLASCGWEDLRGVKNQLARKGSFKNWLIESVEGKFTSKYEIQEEFSNYLEPLRKKHNRLSLNHSKVLNDLDTLERELTAVVANYPAKKAYEELKRIGLDMGDFKEDADLLPVPIALSVSIDLVNKNEKAASAKATK